MNKHNKSQSDPDLERGKMPMRADEQQLRMMFDSMTEGVALNEIVYDDQGEMIDYRILTVNRAFYSQADYRGKQVIGNVATSLYGMTSDSIKSFWEEHRQRTTTAFTEMWSPLNNKCFFVATSPFVENKFVTSFMDITERKLTEKALYESEENWRSLVMTIPDYVAIHDRDGKYLFLNHYADGFTEKDVIGRSIYDFIKPDSRPLFKQEMDQVQKTGKMQQFEFPGLGTKGELREYEETLVPLKSSNGETNILAFARDITERKQVEDRLRESEERYRDLVENSHELIYTHDLDGRLLSVNHTAALMLGYNPNSLVGRNLGELLAPEQRAQFKDYLDRIRRKASDTGTWVLQSATGDRRTWEYHSMTRPDAKQRPNVRGMAHDITERIRVESALRESEERFQKIFDEGPIGMVLTSHYLQFFSANPAFCRMLGYTSDEMNSQTFLEVTHPEHREQDRQNMEKLWQGEIPEYRTQKRYIAKNGSLRWGSLSISILRGQDGEPQYALSIVEDITKRKHAEEATQRRNAELTALNQIGQALNKLARLDDILELIFTVIGQVLDNRNLFIALYNRSSQTISFPVYAINHKRIFGGDRPLGNGITDYIIRTNTPLLVKRNLAEALAQRGIDLIGTASRSFMAVPMCLGDKVIGVIALQDYDRENAYDEQQLELLATMAAQASTALENARLFDAVQQELEERKQAEEALQESEEKYRNLVENSIEGIGISQGNHLVFANQALVEILGYDTPEECLQVSLLDHVAPESRNMIQERLVARGKGEPITPRYEYKIIRKDGTIRDIEISTSEITFGKGRYTQSTFRDITERKRAEAVLHESEERYHLLYENSLDAVLLTIPDGTVLAANPAACKLFGRSEQEICRLGRDAIIDPSDPRLPAAIEKRARTGSFKGELTGLRSNGTRFPFEITSSIFKDHDGNLRTSMIIRDISEHKQAEQALRQSEARYRAILEQAAVGISQADSATGKYIDVNQKFCDIVGYSRDEILGTTFQNITHPDDLGADLEYMRQLREGKIRTYSMEKRFYRKDKSIIWVNLTVSPLWAVGEEPSSHVAVVEDITERKQAEVELAQSHEQLRALSQYLQAAREEERTFIAREIHDELGQELTALKMDLAWLSRQLPPEQTHLVQKTAAISNMVDGTIQTVRRVASQLRPGLLDDLGLVAALEWQAGEFQARTGIACSLNLPENVTELSQDQATAMFRVFQETLTNIARHAQATRVRIALKEHPDCIELTVRDNGIGITADQLADQRSLGLTGMRERVQAFGGSLEFKSAPGKGTTVRAKIPVLNMPLDKEA